ncbi:GNAT family N-acetyltransferase [Saccharothrix sp. 6-C]|uniref:GNAT family N-acetyltransferase n=1 Tax=Saccharothrix sp. 6-C TaxID=2781735 RepID=UPI0019176DE7|nr:GNAT family N-acetyltransferase [Saccharothrix sp. 6-C]QQQ74177.1 GNAT family N-acetyltransferase [Saccharothrix sp. 6-C]
MNVAEREPGLPLGRADGDEHPRLVATLTDAFRDDPLFAWLFPDRATRPHRSKEFLQAIVESTAGHGGLVMASPDYACAYLAYPPGWHGESAEDSALDRPGLRDRADAVGTLTRLLGQHRHGLPPHLYCTYIGTRPEAQGQGRGRALMTGFASWCDANAVGFYAEATSPRSLALYERTGFPRLGDPITLPNGPRLQPVWRSPTKPGTEPHQ